MNDLTLSFEPATGEAIIEGPAAGPAGEAALALVEGLDLAFDRADGHLVRVIAGAENTCASRLLARLFGARTLSGAAMLSPEPRLCAALSRLARLDAARATSPVWASPWWPAEAAVLAAAAGLHDRALAEARRAVRALGQDRLAVPGEAARTARAVADIAARADQEAARRLRENIVVADRPGLTGVDRLDVAAEIEGLARDCVRLPGLNWMLDPGLAPAALFKPGLSPHSDLLVSHDVSEGLVVVRLATAAGAERADAAKWRIRLVDPDPAARRILTQACLADDGRWLRAELKLPVPLAALRETWIEVVEDSARPVRSAKAHRIQRALRWADAALRAERALLGLAPWAAGEDWAALAAAAWERCGRDWAAAGDLSRAAGARFSRAPSPDPGYLAEHLGE